MVFSVMQGDKVRLWCCCCSVSDVVGTCCKKAGLGGRNEKLGDCKTGVPGPMFSYSCLGSVLGRDRWGLLLLTVLGLSCVIFMYPGVGGSAVWRGGTLGGELGCVGSVQLI